MDNKEMNIKEFVTNCIEYGFEFSIRYCDHQFPDGKTFDEYCLQMILGNTEYIIPTTDEFKLADLWYNVIVEYYIY